MRRDMIAGDGARRHRPSFQGRQEWLSAGLQNAGANDAGQGCGDAKSQCERRKNRVRRRSRANRRQPGEVDREKQNQQEPKPIGWDRRAERCHGDGETVHPAAGPPCRDNRQGNRNRETNRQPHQGERHGVIDRIHELRPDRLPADR